MNIPQNLYRGDSDPNKTRKLKSSWNTGFLLTNLSDGGNGREIFSDPLIDLICRHVDVGWQKTHFLSFSECKNIALKFAAGQDDKRLIESSENAWDAVVIYLCKDKFTFVDQIGDGIYKCQFDGGLPKGVTGTGFLRIIGSASSGIKKSNIILIDTVSYLKKCVPSTAVNNALEKAKRDMEWLILPVDPVPNIPGELSCLLDDGCLSKVEFYRFL